jgi:hypothetical protein
MNESEFNLLANGAMCRGVWQYALRGLPNIWEKGVLPYAPTMQPL